MNAISKITLHSILLWDFIFMDICKENKKIKLIFSNSKLLDLNVTAKSATFKTRQFRERNAFNKVQRVSVHTL